MFVLTLSLQMHLFACRAWRRCVNVLARGVQWVGIPSPGLRYLLAVSAPAIGNAPLLFGRLVSFVTWNGLNALHRDSETCRSVSGSSKSFAPLRFNRSKAYK